IVQQQEWVEFGRLPETESAAQVHTRTLEGGGGSRESLDRSYGHLRLLFSSLVHFLNGLNASLLRGRDSHQQDLFQNTFSPVPARIRLTAFCPGGTTNASPAIYRWE